MIIKNAEYILSVEKEKSFSKAAKKLFISQPALSAAIQKEESKWGVTFFNRSSNPIEVTEEGAYYIKTLKKILQLQEDMEQHFSTIAADRSVELRIGAPIYFCAHILPAVAQNFKAKYPNCNINIFEANDEDLTHYLKSDVIDVAITVEDPIIPNFESHIIGYEYIILAVPSKYEVNKQLKSFSLSYEAICNGAYEDESVQAINIENLKDQSFLMLRKGNDMYKRAYKICRMAGFEPKVAMSFDQMLTSYYVALSGKGVTFIRGDLLKFCEPTKNLCFYKIANPNTRRSIKLICSKDDNISQIANNFKDFCMDNKVL